MITRDDIKLFDLKLFQPRHGYRYSLDPLLLCRFCGSPPPASRIADLGAGCGVIALVLARLNADASVVAVENNPEMAETIGVNIKGNMLDDRVTVLAEDVNSIRRIMPDSTFDLVVSNPPFRKADSGRVSPKAGRDAARHESTATLADFMSAAKFLVKPSGRICFIHLPSRMAEFIAAAATLKLSLLRLRMVHNDMNSPAVMFMAELAKGRRASPVVEPPLFVRDPDGEYTGEVWR